VFLHPVSKEEYALARQERKTVVGYHGFVFDTSAQVSLEEDLLRRDFTINAMARTDDGALIDPYGGQADLAARVLRHVSPAFAEDPVRILRLARFATKLARFGFTVAPETVALCQQMVGAGEVDALVPERVWKETERALMHERPSVYLQTLRQVGALPKLFPELEALFGVPQRADYHPEIDTGVHTLMCVDKAAEYGFSLTVRVAALCHDYGKALTPPSEWPSHRQHEQRGLPLVRRFAERLRIPNALRDVALIVCAEHLNIHRVRELRASTLLSLLERCKGLEKTTEAFEAVLNATLCDAQGRLHFETAPYPQVDYLRAAAAVAKAVTAAQVMRPDLSGPAVGQALAEARGAALKAWMAAR
jgi:tRNA nucleotidyltransferase (CCA-adding enzyme)